MDWNTPGLPVHHQLLELAQAHVHWVGDAIQPSHPLYPLLLHPSIFPRIRVFSFFFLILFFNFTILYWFCHISKNPPQVYMCSPSWTLLLLSPHTIPLGHPSGDTQASSIVHRTWTGISFHIWYYTYFNAILPNHPTLSLSHRVQKTVLYISVSFAVSYTGWLLPSF